MEQKEDGSFGFAGRIPAWFSSLNPEVLQVRGFRPEKKSDFLANFLIDAAEFWSSQDSGQLPSGPWIEYDGLGNTFELEATAVVAGQKRLLLLEKVSAVYQEKQAVIQKGRELQLDYLHLQKMKKNLLRAYEDIEKQIAQRTMELVHTNERLQQEISERQKTSEALKQNENFLHSIFDSIQDGIIIIDLDFTILRNNLAMAKIWGNTTPIEGKKCFTAWQGRPSPCLWCTASQTIQEGKVLRQVISSEQGGKSPLWLELVTFPLRNDAGRLTGVIEYFRDITELKQTEAKEAGMQEQIRKAQKMEAIGTLSGGIAHDFNNILNAIMGYTELALLSLSDMPSAEEIINYLEEALQAEERAKDLIRQILTISRQMETTSSVISMGPIVKEALRFIRATIPSTINIRTNIPDDLWNLEADPTRIHQIIMNLCTNASDAMGEKGGILEVKLANVAPGAELLTQWKELEAGAYILLSVRDTGCGMSPEVLSRLFDPYFTTKDIGKGTGLGLAVVQGIVKSQRGEISVVSEPGQGSTFSILFPAAHKELLKVGGEENVTLKGKERILLIEDEQMLANLWRESLGKLGYQMLAMTNSLEALDIFRKKADQFDLVISDLTMPLMTGEELAKEFLAIRPEIPIILCSGLGNRMTGERVKSMGIKAFIMKPFTARQLAATIRQILDVP